MLLPGSRAFVFVVYLVLGLSFVAETVVLGTEFWDAGWFTIATHDSHLFLFFPLLGTVALAAFYVPSCVFVDLYWRHIKFGAVRFALGAIGLAALAWWISAGLTSGDNRSIWEIAPQTLQQDREAQSGCGKPGRPACDRASLLDALDSVRKVSQKRPALKELVRECGTDALVEAAKDRPERRRFCFAATPLTDNPPLLTDRQCCEAQERFMSRINALAKTEPRALTGRVHLLLLPLKIFFLLVLLAISVLLAWRNSLVNQHYSALLPRIELGVVVGAVLMIFFPLMSQGYALTADALYGTRQEGGFKPIIPLMSFGFGAWGLLILLFFYHRRDRQMEMIGKMSGVLASAVAVLKYDLLISYVTRIIGAGASPWAIGGLAVLAFTGILVLLVPFWLQLNRDASLSPADEPPV